MKILLSILLIITLGIVIYQDFRFRAVSWIVFPLIFSMILAKSIAEHLWINTVQDLAWNTLFLMFQFSFLYGYFSIKSKRFLKLDNRYIGLGDLLFLLAITPMFSPVLFIPFLILSLLFTLIIYGVFAIIVRDEHYPIPLAGVLAGCLELYILSALLFSFNSGQLAQKIQEQLFNSSLI
jgi:hypothetical protein